MRAWLDSKYRFFICTVAFSEFGEEVIARMLEFGKPLSDRDSITCASPTGPLGLTLRDSCQCQLSVLSTLLNWRDACNLVENGRAAKLAAIPAGESPANRGVQSLL